ncbi:MAG: flagellar hook-associated protein FlgL [Chitinivibrionia bacterium]|nr:flagellar hook-associated protein FlgL [Chitinivibrionia bacterium]
MIRTTFQSTSRHTQKVIRDKFAELNDLQQKMATGKQITRPSDAPIDTANVIKLKTQNSQLRQYEKNIQDGLAWMQITDTTMVSMNSIVQRARELAIQGDTDTLSTTQRRYIAEEVEQLTRQAASLMNTRYKGDYLFSGAHTDRPAIVMRESLSSPQDKANGRMCYFDGTQPTIQIMGTLTIPDGSPIPGGSTIDIAAKRIIPSSMEISVSGVKMEEHVDYRIDYLKGEITLMGIGDKYPAITDHPMYGDFSREPLAVPGHNALDIKFSYMDESRDLNWNTINTDSRIYRIIEENISVAVNTTINDMAVDRDVDIFTSLIKLGEGLTYGNRVQINEAIGWLDRSADKILTAQSTNGSLVNRFDLTLERNETRQVEVTRLQSNLEDADYANVVTQYAVKQTVFNTALSSTARIIQSSLMNYLR